MLRQIPIYNRANIITFMNYKYECRLIQHGCIGALSDYRSNFDNIGNRITAAELADEIAYSANNLNQYTAIEKNSGTPFVPTFDDDGNQLTVQTATGVWNVTYNAENRPITFTQGTTVIECKYDSMGRRFEKKVTANNVITFWQRYAYKGYLQIAAFNVLSVNETEVLSLATTTYWDPTEPTATRPLAFTDHTVATPTTYFYTHDLTKNVCEVLSRNGSAVAIVTEYDYTPFGAVTASNSTTPNTFTFSSEVLDSETSLIYYNYRHYNPTDGRWISRDPIEEKGGFCLYIYIHNRLYTWFDYSGLDFAVIVVDCVFFKENGCFGDGTAKCIFACTCPKGWLPFGTTYPNAPCSTGTQIRCIREILSTPPPKEVPWYVYAGVLALAAVLIVADGPLPVGDAAAASIIGATVL